MPLYRSAIEGSKAVRQALMDVWHGSNREFERFSMERRLEGSGEAAFGAGGHFSESPGYAGKYGDKLYKAQIPKEGYLDWELPLSKQPESVRGALADLGLEGDPTGFQIYKRLEGMDVIPEMEYPDEAVAKYLSSKGIPGVKFKEGGATNYTVFDPDVPMLNMGTEARMARAMEQGYGPELFHGSVEDLSKLNDERPFFAAEEPRHANEYTGTGDEFQNEFMEGELAFSEGEEFAAADRLIAENATPSQWAAHDKKYGTRVVPGANVTKLRLRINKPLDLREDGGAADLVPMLREIGIVGEIDHLPGEGATFVVDYDASTAGQRLKTIADNNINDLMYEPEFRELMDRRGYDGLVNMDSVGRDAGLVHIALRGSQVRSVNAKFDPASKNDLLGSATASRLAAVAATGLAGSAYIRSLPTEAELELKEDNPDRLERRRIKAGSREAAIRRANKRERTEMYRRAAGHALRETDEVLKNFTRLLAQGNPLPIPKPMLAAVYEMLRPELSTLAAGIEEGDPYDIAVGVLSASPK